MRGSIHADATEIAHRRGDSGTADAVGCRVRRVSRARRASARRRPPCRPLRPFRGTATRRALAAAEPPLTGTVWEAVIAATVEHACTTHGVEVPAWTQAPESFLKRPSVFRRGPTIERAAALANASAAFVRHNTFIEPRNLDERGGERHVWADYESAAPRVAPVRRKLNLFVRANKYKNMHERRIW